MILSGLLAALFFFVLVDIYLTTAQPVQPILDQASKLQALQQTIFPHLTDIMANSEWKKEVFFSPEIVALFHERRQRLSDNSACTPQPTCIVQSWEVSQHERQVFGTILQKIPKHFQWQYNEIQWNQDVDAINYIFSVYGEGNAPHYPQIDAASVDVLSLIHI